MTLTTTYMPDLSRVRVAFTAAPAGTDHVHVERSTDGVNWVTVRGGLTVPVNAGAGKVDDYEFEAGELNTYRASYVDSTPSYVGLGSAVTGNNVSVVVPQPAGLVAGDVKLIWASIRNSGVGTVNTPAGWTLLAVNGNAALLGRLHVPGDGAPTVTFAGGVAGADTIARMAAFRNLSFTPTLIRHQLNASAQNIANPVIVMNTAGFLFQLVWKQDDLTSTTAPAFSTKIADVSSTVGDDASEAWYVYATGDDSVGVEFAAPPVVVIGGAAAISRSTMVMFSTAPFSARETSTITPAPMSVWVKNPARPSLNTAVVVTDFSDITRPGRSAAHEVVGRTLPIAVTDVMGSRRLMLSITTTTLAAAAEMDKRLAAGEPIFLQAPEGVDCPIPTMYALIDGTVQRRKSMRTKRRYFDLPLIECAAPGPTITGDTILWADVIATYATWADVIAAKATWSDLIDSIADSTVIVP